MVRFMLCDDDIVFGNNGMKGFYLSWRIEDLHQFIQLGVD